LHDDVAGAARAMARVAPDTHAPDPDAAALLEEGYRRYRTLFAALAPSFRELAC
jgi:hypothetical protein